MIFQFGVILPDDPTTNLNVFLDDDDNTLHINLVRPEEPPRDGKPRRFKTDKNRFLIKGKRDNFEVLEIKPQKALIAKLKQSYHFFGKQSFGIVTNIVGDKPGDRELQFEVYEVVTNGHIILQTDDCNNTKVLLVYEGETEVCNGVELKPTDVKSYNENNIITPKDRKKLRTGYIENLFAGISTGDGFLMF